MTVTASSGSPRVSPQLFDTLPLSSVRQAEQQDRFPDGGELDTLITFFRSGNDRLEASKIIASNAEATTQAMAPQKKESPLSVGTLVGTALVCVCGGGREHAILPAWPS